MLHPAAVHAPASETTRRARRLATLAFVTGAAFFAYAFVLRVAPSVMVGELMAAFGVGGAVLGNLSAFYFYAYSGLQIPVGLLFDRLGPRRLMSGAALVVGCGALLFAWADTIGTAYAGRLLIGAGCAFSWAGTLFIVNRFFPHRFALLAGVSQMIAMLGGVLGQAPLAVLVEHEGWRTTTGLLAVVGLVLAVALYLVVRDGEHAPSDPSIRSGSVVRNPQTWLCAYFGLAMVAPVLAFGALWGVPYLMSAYDFTRTEAAGITSLTFLGNGAGSVAIGAWSDRIRRRKLPMLTGAVLCVIPTLAYVLVPSMPVAVLASLVFLSGFGSAAMVLGVATALELNPARYSGLTVGVINMAVTGAGAMLQPLIGWLLDLAWDGTLLEGARVYASADYRMALTIVPVLGIGAILLLPAIRETGGLRAAQPGR